MECQKFGIPAVEKRIQNVQAIISHLNKEDRKLMVNTDDVHDQETGG